jgi:hypothetical protein
LKFSKRARILSFNGPLSVLNWLWMVHRRTGCEKWQRQERLFSPQPGGWQMRPTYWKFIEIDTFGTKPNVSISVSQGEKWSCNIFKETTRHNGKRYESGLLW